MKYEQNFQGNIDLVSQSLDDCYVYIDALVEKIQEFAACYKKSDFLLANKIFSEIIDILDIYTQLFSKTYNTIKSTYSLKVKQIDAIQDLETGLLSILKHILSAKQKEDMIMIGDLLENDLIGNLNQWKTQVIPILFKSIV